MFRRDAVRVIVFDAGGTLLHPDPPVPVIYARVAAKYGVACDVAELDGKFRDAFRRSESAELPGLTDPGNRLRTSEAVEAERWRWIVRESLGDFPDFEACYVELFAWFARPEAWACYPDVLPVLSRLLEDGWPLALASNFDHRLHAVCEATPELARLQPRCISAEIGFRKPAPEFFAAVAAKCDCAPGELLMVGDDPNMDVAGARDAGWQAVLIDRRGRTPGLGLSSLAELLPLLPPR